MFSVIIMFSNKFFFIINSKLNEHWTTLFFLNIKIMIYLTKKKQIKYLDEDLLN